MYISDDKSSWWGCQKVLCLFWWFGGSPSKWLAGESIPDQSQEVAMHYPTSDASPWQPFLSIFHLLDISALIDRINLWTGEQLIEPTLTRFIRPLLPSASHETCVQRMQGLIWDIHIKISENTNSNTHTHQNIWEIYINISEKYILKCIGKM